MRPLCENKSNSANKQQTTLQTVIQKEQKTLAEHII